MPNRYIRESAIESEAVNAVTWQAEIFWRRLLNRVDDFGRFTGNPSLLRALIFPLQLDRVRDADIPRLLTECEKAGLLFVYSVAGKQCLVLNKWENGRAKSSQYPPPPEDICSRMKTFVYERKHKFSNAPDSDSDSDTNSDSDNSGFPESLKTPEFKAKWAEYLSYRTENKLRALKPKSVEKTLAEMSRWGQQQAIISIDTTIRNAWQGLFEPKSNGTNRPPNAPVPWQRDSHNSDHDKGF